MKIASRSALEVSFRARVMVRRLVAYFLLATIIYSGFFVTFERPAYPTEDTALVKEWLPNINGPIGEPGNFSIHCNELVRCFLGRARAEIEHISFSQPV